MDRAEKAGDWNAVLSFCTPRGQGSIIQMALFPLLLDAYAQPGGGPGAGKASRDLIEKFEVQHWRRLQGAAPDDLLLGLAKHLGDNAAQFVAAAMRTMDERFVELLLLEEAVFKEKGGVALLDVPDQRFRLIKVGGRWLFDGEVETDEDQNE